MSVCHAINMTSLSICQLHDSSVCQPKHNSTWNSIYPSVYVLSVLSIQPSAKFMVKIPMSVQYPEKFLSIHTSSDSSVDPSGSPSVTSSPSAENLSKTLGNHGEKNAVNYLHKIPVNHHPSVLCQLCLSP